VEERHDLGLEVRTEPSFGCSSRRPAELHPVLLGEALDLAVADHRQPRHRRQQRRDPERLVAGPELLDRGLLVGVRHEVHVALEDLGVELDGLADDLAVARVVLVAEHVHERAVVDAVHAERPDEVALEQPERLGEEQRVGRLGGDPVDDLAPELVGHPPLELRPGHRVLAPRRDRAAMAGLRPPQPLDVLLREDHRRVEPDHRKRRATSRIVWMTASRTSGFRKSSWAVSFHGKLVPSLPW
jgi:hypothetical protein